MRQYYPNICNEIIDNDEEWLAFPEGDKKQKIIQILNNDRHIPMWKAQCEPKNKRLKSPKYFRLFNVIADAEGNSVMEQFQAEEPLPDELVIQEDAFVECRKIISRIKRQLSKREFRVLYLWATGEKQVDALEDMIKYKRMTFKDIGRELHKSDSTVNSIQKRAIKKIRSLDNFQELKNKAMEVLAWLPRVNNLISPLGVRNVTAADIASYSYPCGVMEYLYDSFRNYSNDNLCCPGGWNKVCSKEVFKPRGYNCDVAEIDIQDAVKVLGLTEYKIRKLCSKNQLPYKLAKRGNTRKIMIQLNQIKDCGQNVWCRSDYVFSEEKKEQYKEYIRQEKLFRSMSLYDRRQSILYADTNALSEEERISKELKEMEKERMSSII